MQALQGQQALLQEQLAAAEASMQEAMAARQLQTERIKASKAAQKTGRYCCALAQAGSLQLPGSRASSGVPK